MSFIPKRNLIWQIFVLEIQTSLLRMGSTGILKLAIGYSQTTPRRSQSGTGFESRLTFQNSLKHFKDFYKGQQYFSDFPPSKQFANHPSCKAFPDFVFKEILKRLTTGALRVWGEASNPTTPYLVLPLTVEPTKPRLRQDARFLNLWMTDAPFSLDLLAGVPRYVYKGPYMAK